MKRAPNTIFFKIFGMIYPILIHFILQSARSDPGSKQYRLFSCSPFGRRQCTQECRQYCQTGMIAFSTTHKGFEYFKQADWGQNEKKIRGMKRRILHSCSHNSEWSDRKTSSINNPVNIITHHFLQRLRRPRRESDLTSTSLLPPLSSSLLGAG